MMDISDGKRYADLELSGSDLAILVHADGAAISKSTSKKLYLMFIQCIDLPLRLRRSSWFLQSVWVGHLLPKDREAFLVELTQQLNELRRDSPNFNPITWRDEEGNSQSSSVTVHSVLMDSPERTAISGTKGHTSAQGCIYCEQVPFRKLWYSLLYRANFHF